MPVILFVFFGCANLLRRFFLCTTVQPLLLFYLNFRNIWAEPFSAMFFFVIFFTYFMLFGRPFFSFVFFYSLALFFYKSFFFRRARLKMQNFLPAFTRSRVITYDTDLRWFRLVARTSVSPRATCKSLAYLSPTRKVRGSWFQGLAMFGGKESPPSPSCGIRKSTRLVFPVLKSSLSVALVRRLRLDPYLGRQPTANRHTTHMCHHTGNCVWV